MLEPRDLLAPRGRIEGGSFFPDLSQSDLDARLQEYIDQGNTAATDAGVDAGGLDEATLQYAYWRAFDAVHLRLSSNPITASTTEAGGGASASFSQAQIDRFGDWASEALQAYEALLPVGEEGGLTGPPSTTTFLPNSFVF